MNIELSRAGIGYALLAYSSWGLLPLFWRFLAHVPAFGILSHRIVWSFLFYGSFVYFKFRGEFAKIIREVLHYWKIVFGCGVFLSINWGLYVWAVNNNHVLESSLGYFINPLINVVLGVLFLKEKFNFYQKIALVIATAGVIVLAIGSGAGIPWIALTLAVTFGFYGLLRKKLAVNSFVGSMAETLFMIPLTLFWFGNPQISSVDTQTAFLLAAGGIVTGMPLIWFSEAAKRLPLSIMGYFQYIAPTLQFLCAVIWFKEPFMTIHAYSFGLIWLAIGLNFLGLRR